MLKKNAKIEWSEEAKKAFYDIKQAIKSAPILILPDFNKPIQKISFASYHTIVAVLLQENSEGFEQPISFFKISL